MRRKGREARGGKRKGRGKVERLQF